MSSRKSRPAALTSIAQAVGLAPSTVGFILRGQARAMHINTLWYATAWIAPAKDMAFFAVTNAGGDTGFEAADRAIEALLARNRTAPRDAPIDGDPPASASGDTTP